MDSVQTTTEGAWKLKVASLIIPTLITCLVPILFFSALGILQFVGSGIILSIIILSLTMGDIKHLPDKDVAIIWVAALLYNFYLLVTTF